MTARLDYLRRVVTRCRDGESPRRDDCYLLLVGCRDKQDDSL
jgi:hypothetical protein